mmetsp:Transcript_75006/g.199165  ORF Transcript_75006/g.199165 Transcript_75006/m.199165 type:complete len:240 (-) Transcript_75006:2-721(-)
MKPESACVAACFFVWLAEAALSRTGRASSSADVAKGGVTTRAGMPCSSGASLARDAVRLHWIPRLPVTGYLAIRSPFHSASCLSSSLLSGSHPTSPSHSASRHISPRQRVTSLPASAAYRPQGPNSSRAVETSKTLPPKPSATRPPSAPRSRASSSRLTSTGPSKLAASRGRGAGAAACPLAHSWCSSRRFCAATCSGSIAHIPPSRGGPPRWAGRDRGAERARPWRCAARGRGQTRWA